VRGLLLSRQLREPRPAPQPGGAAAAALRRIPARSSR
jgi:hypothetical protein